MFRTVGERTSLDSGRKSRRSAKRDADRGLIDGVLDWLDGQSGVKAHSVGMRRPVQLSIDIPLLLVVLTLLVFGMVMVYSASYDYSSIWFGNPSYIFSRQLLWLAIGLVAAVFLMFFNYHSWGRLVVPVMGATVFLLVSVLVVSEVRHGAVRTLYGGSIQPSELAKFVTIVYLSVWLHAKGEQLHDVNFGLFPLAGILGLLSGLILVQPDLSAFVTVLVLGGLMFFLAGGDLRQIGILIIVALLVGFLVVQVSSTGSDRLTHYFAGLKDPSEGSYHVKRSFEAFVKGGWFGSGIGKAETKLTGLPVPPTDSIFAVVGEETGVMGAVALIGLYFMLLWRGLVVARRAPDQLGSLLAAGLILWIAFEAFVNMAVMVNVLPFAGNALPFISAGGSSLVVSLSAIGIVMNVSRLSSRKTEESGKLFNAVVNMRGRDRRRRVSSRRGAKRSSK